MVFFTRAAAAIAIRAVVQVFGACRTAGRSGNWLTKFISRAQEVLSCSCWRPLHAFTVYTSEIDRAAKRLTEGRPKETVPPFETARTDKNSSGLLSNFGWTRCNLGWTFFFPFALLLFFGGAGALQILREWLNRTENAVGRVIHSSAAALSRVQRWTSPPLAECLVTIAVERQRVWGQ